MNNLKEMSFAELKALRTFANEELKECTSQDNYHGVTKWNHHIAIIQQHINKKVAEYFNEEPRT